ncbi:hypothetical protein [Chitinophaga sp. MM2321]|uniref:hypothetical protein n=1 Tax=Chitinophaga sp. MM2321 TaxID=3137178 RepID=UPI0032D597B9
MQPNNVLDPRRLGFYFRQHFTANYRPYLLGILSMFGLMTAIPVLMLVTGNRFNQLNDIVAIYYIGLFFVGLLFTSMAFSEFSNKEKGVNFLMLPASQFEKFITMFLITSIGFLLVYHLCAYSAYLIVVSVKYSISQQHIQNDWDFFTERNGHVYFYYTYIFLHSVFLLGAVSFNKAPFIKTIVALFAVLFALYILNGLFSYILFGSKLESIKNQFPFVLINTHGGNKQQGLYLISQPMQDAYKFIAQYLLAPILWTIAYFRLKDKEI